MFYKSLYLCCVFLFLIFGINISHAGTTRKISFLYVLHAKKGEVKITGSEYELILKDPSVHYFTDHPARKIGHVTAQNFIQSWLDQRKDFQTHRSPNSVLISEHKFIYRSNENTTFTILENPKFDPKKNLLSFDLKFLNHQSNLKPGEYKNLDLFVDSCTDGTSILGCF
jgi:hypothetical protein